MKVKQLALITGIVTTVAVFIGEILFSTIINQPVKAEVQAGLIDETFQTGEGYGLNPSVEIAAIQDDGKIIVCGYFTSYNGKPINGIARLNTDGTLDETFNGGSGVNSEIYSIAIQTDGKILIGGKFTSYNNVPVNRIARLNSDGSLDTSFNIGSGANSYIYSIAIQDDGKVIIGGRFTSYNGTAIIRIARLNIDGGLDSSFNIGIGPNGTIRTVAVQDDGKVVVGGEFFSFNGTAINSIVRINTDGSIDTSFNVGSGANSLISKVIIQSDSKVLIVGWFTSYNGTQANGIARLNADGSLDTSFNVGTGANDEVLAVSIRGDGKIVIGGFFTSFNGVSVGYIACLNADGTLDTSFSATANLYSYVASGVVQDDNKVIVVGFILSINGTGVSSIARLNIDGGLDLSFSGGDDGLNAYVNTVTKQADGRIIIGGLFTSYYGISRSMVARINTNGSLDTSFNVGSGVNNTIYTTAVQDDGKIFIGGLFTDYNGTAVNRIARLNSDGSLDTSFNVGSGVNGSVHTIIVQSDGKVIMGGYFTSYNGIAVNRIARLNSDGSLDTSFDVGTGANNYVYAAANDSNDRIIIGGTFTSYNGTSINRIARLNSDGSLDTSFNVGSAANQYVFSIAVDSNDKIVIGGDFTSFNGTSISRIARLNSDGSLDTNFNVGNGANSYISSIALQSNDKIIAGGRFTSFNGITANRIVSLNYDGSIDSSFNIGNGFDNDVRSLVIMNDGNIVAGGLFTSYDSKPAPYLVSIRGKTLHQIEHADPNISFISAYSSKIINTGSENGELDPNLAVNIYKLGVPIARVNLDLSSSDQSLEGLVVETDSANGKAVFHYDDALTSNTCSPNCTFGDIPGAVGATYAMYIPKLANDTGAYICPNAKGLDDVNDSCLGGVYIENGETKTIGDNEVTLTQVTIDDTSYWFANGLSGTGGFSYTSTEILPDTGLNLVGVYFLSIIGLVALVSGGVIDRHYNWQ